MDFAPITFRFLAPSPRVTAFSFQRCVSSRHVLTKALICGLSIGPEACEAVRFLPSSHLRFEE
jgi:hypothetical protein